MSCESIKGVIIDYVGGQLDVKGVAAVERHVDSCAHCQRLVSQEQQLRLALSELPTEGPSEGFFDELMQDVSRSNKPKTTYGFWGGFATASVAAMAAWLVFAPMQLSQKIEDSPKQQVASINAQVDQLKNVRIAFDAPNEFEQVTMSVSLPSHVELVGFPGEREITWTTDISKGKNILTLPLMAKREGTGTLLAKLSSAGKTKVFTIHLSTLAQHDSAILVPLEERV